MTQRPKFAKNSVDTEASNGEITFIAARNVRNLNGFEYQTDSLLAQDATGEYSTLGADWQDVAIPLMEDHGSSIGEKIGNIYTARLVSNGEEQSVEMKAKFFKGDLAQEVRQRPLYRVQATNPTSSCLIHRYLFQVFQILRSVPIHSF